MCLMASTYSGVAISTSVPDLNCSIISISFIRFDFWVQSSCKPNAMELAPIAEAPPRFAV